MEKSKICNIISIVLMGALLILHFVPFWSYDGMSTSIQSYIWFPTDHAALGSYISGQIGGEYSINSIVLMPFVVICTTVLGIVLNIKYSDKMVMSLFPLVCGLVGIWGYLSQDAFQLGTNWGLHLVVCVAMAAVAVIKLYFMSKND